MKKFIKRKIIKFALWCLHKTHQPTWIDMGQCYQIRWTKDFEKYL